MTNPSPVYATVPDIEVRWGQTVTEPVRAQVQALVDDAHAYMRARVPAIDARVRAGTVAAATVTLVLGQMVVSVLRNPEGLKMEMAGVFQRQLDTTASAGRLTLSDEQLLLLGESSGAFTIDMVDEGLPPVRSDAHARRPDRGRWG